MTEKYRSKTPDMVDTIKDLQNRLSVLERVTQHPILQLDGAGGSYFKVVSGADIPPEIIARYEFFGYTTYVVVLYSRGDPDTYIFDAIMAQTGSGTNVVKKVTGIVVDGAVANVTDYGANTFGTFDYHLGLVGAAKLNVGNAFLPGSGIVFYDGGIEINGFPINRIWMTSGYAATATGASADLTLTTTPTNITGALINNVFLARGGWCEVTGVFDFEETVAGTTVGVGELVVDGGAAHAIKARFGMSAITDRATISQTWNVLIAGGSDFVGHSFQLQGSKSIAAGTQIIRAASTSITLVIHTQ